MPFNAYIAFSRSHSRDGIRLLRDLDKCLSTHQVSETLRISFRLVAHRKTKSPWPHRSTSSAFLSHPSHHTLSGPRVSLPLPPLYIIIDIGNPPSGTLTLFNIYVALSRARGRNQIGLLRDFDDKLLTKHPSEYLCLEDERLGDLETNRRMVAANSF
ncbi:hypothetical protein SCLCIDRAFT_1219768 [Scleroderma citrinum Foug A]|uniref:Uncharacterized protein n=1 Tax=Scleroderma citrinum Foug A TaxID=1036808 RepID=A0A0C2ZXB3_9AGAM|nr:hypothetical protein SCLCIDRAFT_1219768 [Scleroderma citrinum Foug A]